MLGINISHQNVLKCFMFSMLMFMNSKTLLLRSFIFLPARRYLFTSADAQAHRLKETLTQTSTICPYAPARKGKICEMISNWSVKPFLIQIMMIDIKGLGVMPSCIPTFGYCSRKFFLCGAFSDVISLLLSEMSYWW